MKKCVNGNCSIKSHCEIYHQAQNMEEARGDGGKFERYSCRKGKCDHYVASSKIDLHKCSQGEARWTSYCAFNFPGKVWRTPRTKTLEAMADCSDTQFRALACREIKDQKSLNKCHLTSNH